MYNFVKPEYHIQTNLIHHSMCPERFQFTKLNPTTPKIFYTEMKANSLCIFCSQFIRKKMNPEYSYCLKKFSAR